MLKSSTLLTSSLTRRSSNAITTDLYSTLKDFSYEDARRIRHEHINRGLVTMYKAPLQLTHGKAQYVWDQQGTKYLDLFAGINTTILGHSNPRLNDALKIQMDKLWHTSTSYITNPSLNYAEKLLKKLPDHLQVCYFTNSGSESNDLALLMARAHTQRFDIITLRNSFHGLTQTLIGATNLSNWKPPSVPTGFGIQKAMCPDVYRGIWGGKNCRDSPAQTERKCACGVGECMASVKYQEQFDDCLKYDISHQGPAGVLMEPIQGAGGIVQLPKGYMKAVFEKVRAKGGVCIVDEVQTGFATTGEHFWGFEMHGAKPDIVTVAKGVGNGFPMGAVVTTKEVAASLTRALTGNTYGADPLAMVVGSTVLDIIEDEGMQKKCLKRGTELLDGLVSIRQDVDIVGDVRGKGLMIGIELVKDKETKQPLERADVQRYHEKIREHGILVGVGGLNGNVLRLQPPMCITKENVDTALDTLRTVFRDE